MIVNATDYNCFGGQPYFVTGLPVAARDLDGDGRQDLFGPYRERGVLVKIDLADARRTPSLQGFDFAIADMTVAQYARFVLLQDQFVSPGVRRGLAGLARGHSGRVTSAGHPGRVRPEG